MSRLNTNRVTRLAEFFADFAIVFFGQFFLIFQSRPNFWRYFFLTVKLVCINCGKKGLGYILGDFFTNSSGHPECKTPWRFFPRRICIS
jgi:hypothetical protein